MSEELIIKKINDEILIKSGDNNLCVNMDDAEELVNTLISFITEFYEED